MLEDRIREIREELNEFEDEFLRYSFLVELSSYVPADQPELMKDENLHRGCQSRVWLRCRLQDGLFYLDATSDTLIIRGVLYVMMQLYNGLPAEEIAQRRVDFLKECGLEEHFSQDRISGLSGIADTIYSYCCSASQTHGNS